MPTLIVFSHLRWGFVHQRPQHLMSRLASRYRVVFVEEPVHDAGAQAAWMERVPRGPQLEVLIPHTPVAARGFHDDQLAVLQPLLDTYLRSHGIEHDIVWFYTPMALPLIAPWRPLVIVYDCVDTLGSFKDDARQLERRESTLLQMADLVFTAGPLLFEAQRSRHPRVHRFPSAVDVEPFFPERLRPDSVEAQRAKALQAPLTRGPRLGFFGVIDERLDIELLSHLARSRPDWQIVMVGPVAKIDPTALPRHDNIHWLGMQPHALLPYLMASWDLCLLPFVVNEATRHISPSKVLEYMAGEKPVVSTPVPDVLALHGDVVCAAQGPAAFVQTCEDLLNAPVLLRRQHVLDMRKAVQRRTWGHTALMVDELIQAAARQACARQTRPRMLGLDDEDGLPHP